MSTTNSLFGQRTRLALSVSDIFPQPKLQAHTQQPDVCHPPGPTAAFLVLTQTPPRATDLFCSWLRVTAFPSLGCTAGVCCEPSQPGSCRISFVNPQGGHPASPGCVLVPPWPALSPSTLAQALSSDPCSSSLGVL